MEENEEHVNEGNILEELYNDEATGLNTDTEHKEEDSQPQDNQKLADFDNLFNNYFKKWELNLIKSS